jgi:hypothetical protein
VLRLKPKFDKLIVALNEDRTAVYEELRKLEIKYAPVLNLNLTRASLEAKKIPELVRLSTLLDFSTFQKDVAKLNLILSRFRSLVSSVNTSDMVYYNRSSQGLISFSLSGAVSILTGIENFRAAKRNALIEKILGIDVERVRAQSPPRRQIKTESQESTPPPTPQSPSTSTGSKTMEIPEITEVEAMETHNPDIDKATSVNLKGGKKMIRSQLTPKPNWRQSVHRISRKYRY